MPLHQRIDQLIAAAVPDFAKHAAGPCSDEEFLRRIYLDLTGTIPPAEQARAFLQNPSPDKRSKLIDRLLASPECARHLATVFDVMLMERRPEKYLPQAQWLEYLRTSFGSNKPWDQLTREILSADGTDPHLRPAAKFFLDREGEPNQITRDIGRLFLGMNLQCAQCHDHPLIEEYKQDHYYGLMAFLNRTFLFTDKAKNVTVLAEKAEGEVSFQSVFDPAKVTKTSGPRVPGGLVVKEPKFDKGKEYEMAPANGIRPIPKFSRRAQLAAQVTHPDNVAFNRNIANRLWALLMGRGLVHPLDMDHPANPPSHPELLALLAEEMAAHRYDVKGFLRELALSQTYQRSSQLPPGEKEAEPGRYLVATLKPLSPEQLAWSLMQATGLTDTERLALGKNATEESLHARLDGRVRPFLTTFGGRPGTSPHFEATLEQALFLANGSLVRDLLVPRPGNLMDRLAKLAGREDLAEELYLSVLTRRPTPEERKELDEYLKGKNANAALREFLWALLTSAEFRFNH
jgi:hypothetical protein